MTHIIVDDRYVHLDGPVPIGEWYGLATQVAKQIRKRHGQPHLTKAEDTVVSALKNNRGHFVSPIVLLRALGFTCRITDSERRIIRVHIYRIRQKLGAQVIETDHGLGYRWTE